MILAPTLAVLLLLAPVHARDDAPPAARPPELLAFSAAPRGRSAPAARVSPEALRLLVEGAALLDAQDPTTASQRLHQALNVGLGKENPRGRHLLARALDAMALPEAGRAWHLAVVRQGPTTPNFTASLDALVTRWVRDGDASDLLDLLGRFPLDTLPGPTDDLRYLDGLRRLASGDPQGALQRFDAVSPEGAVRTRARYVAGVLRFRLGDTAGAEAAWVDVGRAEGLVRSDVELALARRATALAALGIGNARFLAHDYEAASRWFDAIPDHSDLRRQADWRAAWADWYLDRPDAALERLAPARPRTGPTGRKRPPPPEDWLPEATLLQALIHVDQGWLDDAERAILPLEATLRMLRDDLSTRFAAPPPDTTTSWTAWQAGSPSLPAAQRRQVEVDATLAAANRRLEAIEAELATLDGRPVAWRDTVGVDVRKVLEASRSATQARAGTRVGELINREIAHFGDLLGQVDGLREEIRRRRPAPTEGRP